MFSVKTSTEFLERAERSIPLGSQTFSKSRTQFPLGVSPLFASRGEGPYLFDIDGNRYIDFACSLGAITLGYADPDINAAVEAQLKKGVLFSLPSELETEVAEMIIERIPCAEKVRFGKNGSDATAGAVRLARAHTGRDMVAVCGYHGWQDWYIGSTTRNLGVPECTRALTKTFAYNDLGSLEKLFKEYPGQIACIVMEPISFTEPQPGFLEGVKRTCHENGALLVFDEVVTGFRYAPGSAQEYLGVTPDLVTLGKGLANGFPLSAVAGRADIMKLMEEIFFSFTMGGETLSLAATKACLTKSRELGTLDAIAEVGTHLIDGFRAMLSETGTGDLAAIAGHPSWTLITFKDHAAASSIEIKTLFMQECFKRGVLCIGPQFLGYSHKREHVDAALAVYREVFLLLKEALAGDFNSYLACEPLQPLFKVR